MKTLITFALLISAQALAGKQEIQCEKASKRAAIEFMETIRYTSVGGDKVEVLTQTNDDLIFTTTLIFKKQGFLWSDEYVEVTSDLDNHCLIEGVRIVYK